MWIESIYDRTRADVDLIRLDPTNENNKGAYNYTDLNRVETNCEYLMNKLNVYGFQTQTSKPTWCRWKRSGCLLVLCPAQ